MKTRIYAAPAVKGLNAKLKCKHNFKWTKIADIIYQFQEESNLSMSLTDK